MGGHECSESRPNELRGDNEEQQRSATHHQTHSAASRLTLQQHSKAGARHAKALDMPHRGCFSEPFVRRFCGCCMGRRRYIQSHGRGLMGTPDETAFLLVFQRGTTVLAGSQVMHPHRKHPGRHAHRDGSLAHGKHCAIRIDYPLVGTRAGLSLGDVSSANLARYCSIQSIAAITWSTWTTIRSPGCISDSVYSITSRSRPGGS